MELRYAESANWVEDNFSRLQKASGDSQVNALREKAFKKFSEVQIPTTNQEEWRYTNLTPVASTEFQTGDASNPALGLKTLLDSKCLPEEAVTCRFVFLNGKFSRELSVGTRLDLQNKGIEFTTSILECPAIEKSNLGNSFISLNTALLEEVLSLSVAAKRTVEKPIEVVFLVLNGEKPTCYFPRLSVTLEESASFQIVERHLSTGMQLAEISSFGSSVTEFKVAENAELHHVFIQDLGNTASLVGSTTAEIARFARFHSHVIQLGGKLVRNEIHPRFSGTGAECHLNGLTVIGGSQHVDNYTVIDHASPNCFSRENYKGVYGDKSSGVFCGTIIVQQIAQKTNAIQSNKSLLLSNTATIDTKPQLKIWADDVKCTHGATVGQLDEDALFYLRARGIPRELARQMLVKAFIKETIEVLPTESLRNQAEELVESRL